VPYIMCVIKGSAVLFLQLRKISYFVIK
jgi:hypothetical protein